MKITISATSIVVMFTMGLILLSQSACSFMPQISVLEGEERDNLVTLADPIADNLFQGMNSNDYSIFSRDFDDPMKKALNEEAFDEMMLTFPPQLGMYQSREVVKAESVDTIFVITYSVQFEKEANVSFRLNLRVLDETYQVAGLWFDSPKLREK